MGQERGIYRNDCFSGVTEYHVYDSNKVLICRTELLTGYAGPEAEGRILDWLDVVDPISPKGEGLTESLSVSPSPQSVHLVA